MKSEEYNSALYPSDEIGGDHRRLVFFVTDILRASTGARTISSDFLKLLAVT